MAENNAYNAQNLFEAAKNISSGDTSASTMDAVLREQLKTLSAIDETLRAIQKSGGLSQSAAKDAYRSSRETAFRDAYNNRQGRSFRSGNQFMKDPMGSMHREFQKVGKGFLDEFEDELLKGFLGSDFKKQVQNVFKGFADKLGTSVQNIPSELGKQLGKTAMNKFKSTSIGKGITDNVQKFAGNALDWVSSKGGDFLGKIAKGKGGSVKNIASVIGKGGGSLGKAAGAFGKIFSTGSAASGAAAGTTAAGGAATGTAAAGAGGVAAGAGMSAAAATGWGAVIIVAALVAIKHLSYALNGLKDIVGAVSTMFKALKASGNRYEESRKQNLKYAEQRMKEDYNTLIKYPFEMMKQAAQDVEQVWDNTLRTITATQGYTKEGVQDLMAAYAERLRDEGLTKVVSGTSMITNLQKVIESGLSGKLAEEFAYQATVLGNAVPTEDFFGYAGTYASIATNAIRAGKSQAAAIQEANESLYSMADAALYASRELTGGFTTGLRSYQTLYEQAARIQQTAHAGNLAEIQAVMAAVAGEVGAVAPDLASSLTDAVYKAAVGGNDSSLVALRSLAGINAGNTEFLRALAKNPKAVYTTIFSNLAKMYSMSSDNYMEAAAGYAEIFGLSPEAFARINFADLAAQISKMDTTGVAITENLKQLQSGQTTLTAEQLKNQEISEYMINEGLAYVLDNAAARSIQEHMWDEQLNRELMEATYGVELQGAGLEALEMLRSGVKNILKFLNPLGILTELGKKVANMVATGIDSADMDADLRSMLVLGRVGRGNASDLYNLTTRNASLGLVKNLVTLMGGRGLYSNSFSGAARREVLGSLVTSIFLGGGLGLGQMVTEGGFSPISAIYSLIAGGRTGKYSNSAVKSRYSWGGVSKSTGALANYLLGSASGSAALLAASPSSSHSTVGRLAEMLAGMEEAIKSKQSYDEWVASARRYGIADFDTAISEAGYTASQLQQQFEEAAANQDVEEAKQQKEKEMAFWAAGTAFWTTQFPVEYRDVMFDKIQKISDLLQEHVNNFADYFIRAKYYNQDQLTAANYQKLAEIQGKDKDRAGDAVYALAEMLTGTAEGLQDPQRQTNTILSQILVVVSAIMQQNNNVGTGSSLAESLMGLAMGITTPSV